MVSYAIQRSHRRQRTLSISLTTDGEVRVLAPFRASSGSITDLLHRRREWIQRKRQELKERPPSFIPEVCVNGATVRYLGGNYKLKITHDLRQKQGCYLDASFLYVNLPEVMEANDISHAARLEIILWLKKQARDILRQRMDEWSAKLNVRYRKLIISNPTSRWGSCNHRNEIRLNWRIIAAPLPLIDYLIVHELCHIRQKNHSPRFWALVASAIPNYRLRRQQLRALA